jgi:choline kinase
MGLIDFLQPWTTRKVIERQLKGLMGQDINAISCVTPEEYADRFLEFLDNHIT